MNVKIKLIIQLFSDEVIYNNIFCCYVPVDDFFVLKEIDNNFYFYVGICNKNSFQYLLLNKMNKNKQ